jgi:hypothetical protein
MIPNRSFGSTKHDDPNTIAERTEKINQIMHMITTNFRGLIFTSNSLHYEFAKFFAPIQIGDIKGMHKIITLPNI